MMKTFFPYMLMLYPTLINFILILMIMNPFKTNFHPISLMMILILWTFFISLMMNLLYYSLMSYILFLTMIGGLLIIFIYITSLSNNEFFFFNFKMITMNLKKIYPLIMMLILLYMYMPWNFFMNLNSQDSWKINMYQFIYDQSNINIMYSKINNKSSMFIMFYIYYSMICIMNICFKLKSPMRQLIN